MKKLQFFQNVVQVLGAVIDENIRKPIMDKQNKVLEISTQKSKKALQSFLGFANYHRNYIKDFAILAEKLFEGLQGKEESLIKNEERKIAFEKLKNVINSETAVHIPDHNKPFILTSDASNVGIGAILQQEKNGKLEVINGRLKN
jgi:hypothetical protein